MATAPEEAAVAVTLDLIRLDGGTQMRAELNEETRAEYASTIRNGIDLPAVTLFFDGSAYWLADGFHRFFAYKDAGAVELPADVRAGTKRDAILFSVGANANHGLRRSNEDKRKAVLTLLEDEGWSIWSDREIARQCGVDHKTVGRLRDEHLGNSPDSRTVERNGTSYHQNTSNIGGAKAGKGTAKEEREAEQAEHDRQRLEHQAALPDEIKQHEAAKQAAKAAASGQREERPSEGRFAELEEAVAALSADNERLAVENKLFGEMKVEWERGRYAEVVAGLNEQIRVLKSQVETESHDKVSWMKSSKHWKKEAQKLGWKPDIVTIDAKTGALKHG